MELSKSNKICVSLVGVNFVSSKLSKNDVSDCAHDTKHNRQMEKLSPITNVNYVKYLIILTSRLHGQIEVEPVGHREEGEDEGWRQHSL